MSTEDSGPWGEYIDSTHITGDIHFINRYAKRWWVAMAIALLIAPPFGAFGVAYMISSGIVTEGEDIDGVVLE